MAQFSTLAASGFGLDRRNHRYQGEPGFTKADIPQLSVQWAFAVPGASLVRSQPAITAQALFFGTESGTVYALDRQTGCEYWRFQAEDEVRTAMVIGPTQPKPSAALYFGDIAGNVYALRAESGELLWKRRAAAHPRAKITGTPALYNNVLYVPVSSSEVAAAFAPLYPCCTFQGQVTAIDALSGNILWEQGLIDQAPQPLAGRPSQWPQFAPAGVPVWSSPTVDVTRNRLYIGTGQAYMPPAPATSDAIIALDLTDGQILWVQQGWHGDTFNFSCVWNSDNCPQPGPDFDFGAPPILATLKGGQDIILAAAKSGWVFAMDPDNDGAVLWKQQIGRGGSLGGIHWGMALTGDTLFVPVADTDPHGVKGGAIVGVGDARPGLYALNINDGSLLWAAKPEVRCGSNTCVPNFSAAAMAIPGAVFAADLGGTLWAFDANDGSVLWNVKTRNKDFPAVDGLIARGGSIDAAGQVVADGQLVLMSGYKLFGGRPGNAMLVFSPQS